jgi:hypothetical protein
VPNYDMRLGLADAATATRLVAGYALPSTEELRKHVAAEIARWQAMREKAGIEQQQ